MPGPAPLYQPTFPPEFVEQARHLVRSQTVQKRLWQRARMVVLLHEQPALAHTELGRIVGLSDQSVREWRKRWCQGDFSLQDKPRPGRPVVFSPLGPCRSQSPGLPTGA